MENIFVKVIPTRFDIEDEDYDYMFAISTDSLVVIDKDLNKLQEVIKGRDLDAIVCGCADEDSFLDSLVVIRDCIKAGNNPIEWFGLFAA
jgi:hypothetical protein